MTKTHGHKNSIPNNSYKLGENYVIDELKAELNSANKNESDLYNNFNELTLTNKSRSNKLSKFSQSESNLERFRFLEKNSKISSKLSTSKNNSISLRSNNIKSSRNNISDDKYNNNTPDAEADYLLNEVMKNEKDNSRKLREKGYSIAESNQNEEMEENDNDYNYSENNKGMSRNMENENNEGVEKDEMDIGEEEF